MQTPKLDALVEAIERDCGRTDQRTELAALKAEIETLRAQNERLHSDKWLVTKPDYTYLPRDDLEALRAKAEICDKTADWFRPRTDAWARRWLKGYDAIAQKKGERAPTTQNHPEESRDSAALLKEEPQCET